WWRKAMRRNTKWISVCAAAAGAAAVLTAPFSRSASAITELWWQGGTGNLLDANYYRFDNVAPTSSTPNVAPASADYVNFAGGGTGTYKTGTETAISRLRVGYNTAAGGTPPTGFTGVGTGTLTVSGVGTKISLIGGAANPVNAALWVGNAQNS